MSFAITFLVIALAIAITTNNVFSLASFTTVINIKGKDKVKNKDKNKFNNTINKFILLSCF